MSSTCLACGQRFDKFKAPTIDPGPSGKDTRTTKKTKKNMKNKVQEGADTAEVKKTTIPGVLTKVGNLLNYVSSWIPGYQFAKEVANNLSKRTSPVMSLTIFSDAVGSTDLTVTITKKTKRPQHKNKPRSTPTSHNQKQLAKSEPAKPNSPSRRTCHRCKQVFTHRNKLFKHLNSYVDLYEASSMPLPRSLPADDTDNAPETAKAPQSPRYPEIIKRWVTL